MSQQTAFDFARGDQLALLDTVPIVSMTVREGKSTPKVSGATIRSTLRAIDSFCRGDRTGWPSDGAIARVISRSERQVRRAVMALEALQYLVIEHRAGRPRLFRINWGEISLAANRGTSEPGTRTSEPGTRTSEPVTSPTSEPLTGTSEPLTRTSEPSSDEAYKKRTKKRTPPSSPSFRDEHWHDVGAALRRCGVVRWRALLEELRDKPAIDPDHAIAIIDHYRSHPGAWTPVALVDRLRSAHADTQPGDLWWTPLEAWRQAEAIRAAVRDAAETHQPPPEPWRVDAAIARKLTEANLTACVTPSEEAARNRFDSVLMAHTT